MAYTYETIIQVIRDAAQINDWYKKMTYGKIKNNYRQNRTE